MAVSMVTARAASSALLCGARLRTTSHARSNSVLDIARRSDHVIFDTGRLTFSGLRGRPISYSSHPKTITVTSSEAKLHQWIIRLADGLDRAEYERLAQKTDSYLMEDLERQYHQLHARPSAPYITVGPVQAQQIPYIFTAVPIGDGLKVLEKVCGLTDGRFQHWDVLLERGLKWREFREVKGQVMSLLEDYFNPAKHSNTSASIPRYEDPAMAFHAQHSVPNFEMSSEYIDCGRAQSHCSSAVLKVLLPRSLHAADADDLMAAVEACDPRVDACERGFYTPATMPANEVRMSRSEALELLPQVHYLHYEVDPKGPAKAKMDRVRRAINSIIAWEMELTDGQERPFVWAEDRLGLRMTLAKLSVNVPAEQERSVTSMMGKLEDVAGIKQH